MARGYRGMTPEQRLADRRERLLSAAYTQFADPGFSDTTIERLCTSARISNRAFYECFSGREDLMRAVYERCVEDTTAAVSRAIHAAPDSPEARVEAAIRAYVTFVMADRRRARIMNLEVHRAGDAVDYVRQQKVSALAQLIEKALTGFPGGAPENAHLVAVGVIGAVQELLLDRMMSAKPAPIDAVIDTAVNICRKSFTP
jgi:Transcriptional regulator